METGGGTYSSVGNHPQTLFVNTVLSRLVNRTSILEVLRRFEGVQNEVSDVQSSNRETN
jgi:hypothetical protein